ncbi:hypothetical protein P3T36_004989 [Kitasatospora sp. MAP12-15]|uniref:hypothetical protein n=1 Tax=unclassified Kitasatospora TaxID=2633591 RepID=UPI002473DC84|nr:hypothetical protein [Kitasatospora sp. MAP12-44]MDH6112034.1 hypothetical protein [Kitasatospora sp. MAP12-44]
MITERDEREQSEPMSNNNSDLVRADDTIQLSAISLDKPDNLPAHVPVNVPEPGSPAAYAALLATPPDARDITAELAAPPRRKLPWLTLVLAGGVIAAAAFAGGAWYQKNDGTPAASASGSRGAAAAAAGARRGGGAGGGQAAGAPGFTRGTVKLVDGSTVYLTDSNGNTVKVTTNGSTSVQVSKSGAVGDLLPGQSVTVVGTPDSSGGYAASSVTEGGGAAAGAFGGGGGGFGGGGTGGASKSG